MSDKKSKCCEANVFWKEQEYFGKYKKIVWICFRCSKPTEVEEKEEEAKK